MAYPNPILTVGALSQVTDVLEYFNGALLDYTNNPEAWPVWRSGVLIDSLVLSWSYLGSNPSARVSFPMTRAQFYAWIDYWTITVSSSNSTVNAMSNAFRTIHGAKLYKFNEVQGNNNWPVEAVIHWGRIKSLEMAIFGSVGNGGSLTTNSVFTSGTVQSRVDEFTICDLNYLRYGFNRFDSYGSCHPVVIQGPALTWVNDNIVQKRFTFEIPSGILVGDLEVSTNTGSTWGDVLGAIQTGSIVEWPVPAGIYTPGMIQMRVRKSRGAYIEEGPTIQNKLIYS